MTPIFPLGTLDDLCAELEDTNRALLRLSDGLVVDLARLEERRRILLRWRDRLESQISAMERAA